MAQRSTGQSGRPRTRLARIAIKFSTNHHSMLADVSSQVKKLCYDRAF